METYFLESQQDSWAVLREVIKANPMLDEHGQLICRGFARHVCLKPGDALDRCSELADAIKT